MRSSCLPVSNEVKAGAQSKDERSRRMPVLSAVEGLLLGCFLGLEFFLDLLDIHTLGYRLKALNLEGLTTACGDGLVLAVLALQTGN